MVSPEQSHPSEPQPLAIAPEQVETEHSLPAGSPRRRPWLTALAVILVLLGLGGAWRWWQGSRAAPPEAGAAQPQSAPVELEAIESSTVQTASEFVGSLESRSSTNLSPEIDGRITRIFVRPGDRVRAGTPLVQLSPDERAAQYASVLASVNSARAIRASAQSELQALQSERVASVAEVELQNQEFGRTSSLVQSGALARQQLDIVERDRRTAVSDLRAIDQRIQAAGANLAEAQSGLSQAQANAAAAQAQLQDTIIEAPFDGIVGDIPSKLGDFVQTDDIVTSVTQGQVLELEIAIPLDRSPELRTGQRVELLNAEGRPLSTGQISFIAPQANAAAQTVLVKASFENTGGRLLAGQFVRARVIWSEQPGILVPTAAISRLGGETFVFVAEPAEPQAGEPAPTQPDPTQPDPSQSGQPQLVARQRAVKLGDLQGNSYQVLEGLKPGEQIVVSGILNLSDGIPIASTPQNQPPSGQPPQ